MQVKLEVPAASSTLSECQVVGSIVGAGPDSSGGS